MLVVEVVVVGVTGALKEVVVLVLVVHVRRWVVAIEVGGEVVGVVQLNHYCKLVVCWFASCRGYNHVL